MIFFCVCNVLSFLFSSSPTHCGLIILLWCHSVLYHHPCRMLCLPSYSDPPFSGSPCPQLRPEALKDRRRAPRQQLCTTHVHQNLPSLLHFTLPHPSFHSNPPFSPVSPLPSPTTPFRTGDSPQRAGFKPFTCSPRRFIPRLAQPPPKPRRE